MDNQGISQSLEEIYRRLLDCYGPQHWWPAEGPFEMMVGAILTQSAAWRNVEKAIANLRLAEALSPAALRQLSQPELAGLIRPSGYYNAKALKLKSLAQWLGERYHDDLNLMLTSKPDRLHEQLLSIHGIGPETADSILLYGADQPVFVIDAYTRRILGRLGLASTPGSYSAFQALFMDNLPPSTKLFQEYHALLVALAKNVCRKRPLCSGCCLNDICSPSIK